MFPVSGAEQLKDLGGKRHRAAHDFAERRVFGVGQARAIFALGQKQVPQPFGASLALSSSMSGIGASDVLPIDLGP